MYRVSIVHKFRSSVLILALAASSLVASVPTMAQTTVREAAPLTLPGVGGGASSFRDESVGRLLSPGDILPWFSEREIQRALASLDQGRSDDTIRILTAWVASHPTDSRGPLARFAIAWAYVRAESWQRALPWLELCMHELPLLADYCLYWGAQAAEARGDLQKAAEYATAVSHDAIYGPRSRFLRARVLLKLGDADIALSELERFLSEYPRAAYRNEVEIALAETLIALERFDDAARRLWQLELTNPDSRIERTAKALRESITSKMSPEAAEAIRRTSARDRITRANVLYERHRSEQVISSLEPIAKDLPLGSADGCDANHLIARSYTKLRRHASAAPFYDLVIHHCRSDVDERVKALYNGGRAYWNADEDEKAIAHFQALYTEYPNHSYADDAMHYEALIVRGQNRTADSNAILQEQVRRWPQGDMAKDAIWMQMRVFLEASDWAGALRFSEQYTRNNAGEDDIYSRGRIRYFRARSMENLGRLVDASLGYQALIRDFPLSWYASLSFNRLAVVDPTAVGRLVHELRQSAGVQSQVIVLDPPEMSEDPFMRRGYTLLRLGLVSLASDEFSRLESRYASRPGVGRIVARLMNEAGAWHISHRSSAQRISNPDHYPAPDSMSDWLTAYPKPFENHVMRFAEQRGLDPWLVYAVMREESGFQPRIESWANARGLMQLMLPTAKDMAKLTGRGDVTANQLFDPEINIELGTMFLNRLANRYGGHPACMIAGYNGGAGNVNNWLRDRGSMPMDLWVEAIPFAQTRNYVKRVSMSWWIYHWLYDERAPIVQIPEAMPSPG